MYPAFVLPSRHEPVTFDEVARAVHCPDQTLFVRWAAMRDLIPDLSPPICCREMTLSFGCTSSDGATFRCPVCRRERSIRDQYPNDRGVLGPLQELSEKKTMSVTEIALNPISMNGASAVISVSTSTPLGKPSTVNKKFHPYSKLRTIIESLLHI